MSDQWKIIKNFKRLKHDDESEESLGVTKSILVTNSNEQQGIMKFTSIALLAFVGVASAGKPQLSVRKGGVDAGLLQTRTKHTYGF